MSKTINVLPNINNIDFCGRVLREPYVTKNGNVMFFDLIRNFGGNKPPVITSFVMFKPKNGEFPAFLKKGAAVVAHAYVTPVSYTDKNGEDVQEVRRVIKRVEEAQLIQKTVKADEKVDDSTGEEVIEIENE